MLIVTCLLFYAAVRLKGNTAQERQTCDLAEVPGPLRLIIALHAIHIYSHHRVCTYRFETPQDTCVLLQEPGGCYASLRLPLSPDGPVEVLPSLLFWQFTGMDAHRAYSRPSHNSTRGFDTGSRRRTSWPALRVLLARLCDEIRSVQLRPTSTFCWLISSTV